MSYLNDLMFRATDGVVVEVAEITPEIAADILAINGNNRKISKTNLGQLVSDMTEGRWAMNGESIIIADDWTLNDGQHRLSAVVASGVTIKSVITAGVKRDSRFTVDQGRSRSAGAIIAMSGRPYPNELAKTARLVLSFEKANGEGLGAVGKTSTAAVLARIDSDGRFHEAIQYAASFDRNLLPAYVSQVAFWRYLCKADQRKIDFLTAIAGGEMIAHDDNAYIVRARMAREARNDRIRTEIFLRGLSSQLSGESATRIRMMGKFPKVAGIN